MPPKTQKHKHVSAFPTFRDRFDKEYYKFLLEQLSEENLIKNALDIPREINGVNYHKAIAIDFCGFSASLLFNSGDDPDDIHNKDRKAIADRIKTITSETFLKKLNEEHVKGKDKIRYYLRMRLILSYVYSDFCISFMKAEASRNRPTVGSKIPRYSFEKESPLLASEFDSSSIRRDQLKTLIQIELMTKDMKNLLLTSRYSNEKINTLQIRFSVIPTPLSLLFINRAATSFPYIYSLKENRGALSFLHPVTVVSENDQEHFTCLHNHWECIWAHPTTLFCEDCTGYNSGKAGRLITIEKPPDLRWGAKEKRIKDELDENEIPFEFDRISWEKNLRERVGRSTNVPKGYESEAMQESNVTSHSSNDVKQMVPRIFRIEIGYSKNTEGEKKGYYFELNDGLQPPVIIARPKPENPFLFLLHFAYARKHNKIARIQKKHRMFHPRKILTIIHKAIESKRNKFCTIEELFEIDHIDYQLSIDPDNIEIYEDEKKLKDYPAGFMKYNRKPNQEGDILDFK